MTAEQHAELIRSGVETPSSIRLLFDLNKDD